MLVVSKVSRPSWTCPVKSLLRMHVSPYQRHQVKKMEGIVGFIDEMKANLSDHAFSSFKTALALYKEVKTTKKHFSNL